MSNFHDLLLEKLAFPQEANLLNLPFSRRKRIVYTLPKTQYFSLWKLEAGTELKLWETENFGYALVLTGEWKGKLFRC